jgi:hypothetical protein
MDDLTGFQPILEFDCQSVDFARGFEAGRVWAALNVDPDRSVDVCAHGTNAEMFLRMAEATARSVTSEELGNDWLQVTFAAVSGCTDDPMVL